MVSFIYGFLIRIIKIEYYYFDNCHELQKLKMLQLNVWIQEKYGVKKASGYIKCKYKLDSQFKVNVVSPTFKMVATLKVNSRTGEI